MGLHTMPVTPPLPAPGGSEPSLQTSFHVRALQAMSGTSHTQWCDCPPSLQGVCFHHEALICNEKSYLFTNCHLGVAIVILNWSQCHCKVKGMLPAFPVEKPEALGALQWLSVSQLAVTSQDPVPCRPSSGHGGLEGWEQTRASLRCCCPQQGHVFPTGCWPVVSRARPA